MRDSVHLRGGGLLVGGPPTFTVDDPGLEWIVRITCTLRGGALVAHQVQVTQRLDGKPVDGTALRRVPVDSYIDEWLRSDLLLTEQVGAESYEPTSQQGREVMTSRMRQPLTRTVTEYAAAYNAAEQEWRAQGGRRRSGTAASEAIRVDARYGRRLKRLAVLEGLIEGTAS